MSLDNNNMSRLCRLPDNYALSCHGNTVHYRSSPELGVGRLMPDKRAHSEPDLLPPSTCGFSPQ